MSDVEIDILDQAHRMMEHKSASVRAGGRFLRDCGPALWRWWGEEKDRTKTEAAICTHDRRLEIIEAIVNGYMIGMSAVLVSSLGPIADEPGMPEQTGKAFEAFLEMCLEAKVGEME